MALSRAEIIETINQAAMHIGHVTGHMAVLEDLNLNNEAMAYKPGIVVAAARIAALAALLPDAVPPS